LAVKSTSSAPADFEIKPQCRPYYLWSARSLEDSINAWGDLFLRSLEDSSMSGCKHWLDLIQERNPKSVVGYTLAARYYRMFGIPGPVVQAYDKAITSFKNFEDPLIPDDIESLNGSLYSRWYYHNLRRIEREKEYYLNNPDKRSWFDYWR
jgi:hypothetical protein